MRAAWRAVARPAVLTCALVSLALLVSPLAGAGEDPSESTALDEVVVTARRRAEDLSKVPAIVTAFGAEQLEQRRIAEQADLQISVPGLTVRETVSNNYLNYVIRGQTVDAFSGSSTAVVPYVNEVPFTAGGAATFFDLESIQVLKGPQGTLFGRNTTGGAVLVTTAKPRDSFEAFVSGSVGNFDYRDVKGMWNAPLIPGKALLRAAVSASRRDGYQHNVFTDEHLGELHRTSGRVSLTLLPTDALENTTVFQYERSKGNNVSTLVYSMNECGQTQPNGTPLNCAAHFLFGPQLDANIGVPGAWQAYLDTHPGAHPGGVEGALRRQRDEYGYWTVADYSPSIHRGRDRFLSNTTTWTLDADTSIKNIFGWTRAHAIDTTGQKGVPFLVLVNYDVNTGNFANDVTMKTLSDELQLQGKMFDGRLSYIVGGYYQETETRIFYPQTFFDVSPTIPPATTNSNYENRSTSKAVFAHGTYDFGDQVAGLSLSAGARYSWERVTLDQLPGSAFYPADRLRVSFKKPSWNVGLEYRMNPEWLLYVQGRGSWRSGGLNGIAPPTEDTAEAGGAKFLSEVTKDLELGAKFRGEVGGRPAHLYLAAYQQWIEDIQRAQFPSFNGAAISVTVNVPSARVRGFEIEAGVNPIDRLELGATVAYTSAKYRDNVTVIFGNVYEFGPFADTPKWTGTVYGQLTLPLPDALGTLALLADVYAQTAQYISNTAFTREPGTRLPSYSLTNVRLDWSNPFGSGVTASAFARNVFDKGYYVGGLAGGDALGLNSVNPGRPRMYGLELRYDF